MGVRAQELDAAGDAEAGGQRFERGALRPFADDDRLPVRKVREGGDDVVVAFAVDEMADGEECGAGQAEPGPQRGAGLRRGGRAEAFEIDAVPEHGDLAFVGPERRHGVLQPGADGDHRIGVRHGPADHVPRQGVVRQLRHVGPAGRHDDGKAEAAAERDRGDTVRVEVVRVDHVDGQSVAQQAAQRQFRGGVEQGRAPGSCRASGRRRSGDGGRGGRAGSLRARPGRTAPTRRSGGIGWGTTARGRARCCRPRRRRPGDAGGSRRTRPGSAARMRIQRGEGQQPQRRGLHRGAISAAGPLARG